MKSLGSAVAALLVSGFYGLAVGTILGFLGFLIGIAFGFRPEFLHRSVFIGSLATCLFLGIFINPLMGVIWGWTVTLLREKTAVCSGLFLCVMGPVLMLLILKAPENLVSRAEYSQQATEPAKVLMFAQGFVFFGRMALLWIRKGENIRRLPLQKAVQDYVDRSSLGHSSGGVRLLTVVILAQVLIFMAGYYFYRQIFR